MTTAIPELTAEALERDPVPTWAWLRDHAPVCPAPELGLTLVTRHADVESLSLDAEVFTAKVPGSPLVRTLGPNLLHDDGADHVRLRALLTPLLRVGVVRAAHTDDVRAKASDLLDAARHRGQVELMSEYAGPLSAFLLERILGLPTQPPGTLERWFRAIGTGAANFEQDPDKQRVADAASTEIDDTLRAALTGVPIEGSLIAAGAAGGMSFQELSSTVKLFVIGGLQEPRDLLGIAAAALLLHRDQLALLSAEHSLAPRAIEEAARWESPVGTITRSTTRDVELSGCLVPAGTTLAGVLASANRDPARWQDPERYLIQRDEGPHLAFAVGAHRCVGAAVARLLVREALLVLLPSLEAATLLSPPVLRGYEFRGPTAVHLGWV